MGSIKSSTQILLIGSVMAMLFLVACSRTSPPAYSHSSKSAAELEKDTKTCEEGAELAYPDAGRFVGGPIKKDFIRDCMQGKGWMPIEAGRAISSGK